MSDVTLDSSATFLDAETGERLQRVLVAALDLGLAVKQAHWNLTGSGFRPIHLQLDEIADAVREQSDEIAERAATVGTPPDGRAATIAATSPLPTLRPGRLPVPEAVAAIADRLDAVAAIARAELEPLDASDLISQDLLIGFVAVLEKQRWMLRSWLGEQAA